MIKIKCLIAGALMFGTFIVPASANDRDPMDGSITIFTKTGMSQMMVSDAAMLDEIVKGAEVIDDHSMIVNHNGKMYIVKDHKLGNGRMISDVLSQEQGGKGGNR